MGAFSLFGQWYRNGDGLRNKDNGLVLLSCSNHYPGPQRSKDLP
ncbi:hypothetical protein DFO60_2428 [Ectopseudomonas oleovorans]|uniref:Uncharacterized protein n=1 Tax=Ectopseudomonas oleovorans TaxID=301 RepID=A0A3D9ER57_ECTOL|nr:hypothetical protein DFO60_2428 [Pseudomonas oleovorans]